MAGVSAKAIKSRIKSMESTKQITKAMEMVAASKLRHAQARILNSRPYFETLYSTVTDIVNSNHDFSSIYLTQHQGGKDLYIVIASDRGLAGGYNNNVLKAVMADIGSQEATVLPVGKKAVDFFRRRNIALLTTQYETACDVTIGDCFSIARTAAEAFCRGDFQHISIAYTNFVSVLTQEAAVIPLLPLLHTKEKKQGLHQDMEYEPSCEEVFNAIVPEYLGGIIYGALCESQASEHAARRTAMDAATSNADEMITDLNLKFNRARQAAITQEITEIVAGSQT
jgi:F-type H+-transporting ATPase subunit gamma